VFFKGNPRNPACSTRQRIQETTIQYRNETNMNFIRRLFTHRHSEAETHSTSTGWVGQSGKEYQYEICPFDTSFRPLPGNYIYAMRAEGGGWIPIYIAQTRDLHQRLEGHVRLGDAEGNGATHLHAHYCSAGQSARCDEERDLLLRWKPVCNEPVDG
jgi:hypothetical protein